MVYEGGKCDYKLPKKKDDGGELGNLTETGYTVIDHFYTPIAKTARLPICPLPYGI